jgi:large subunit ribosomal protein L6e
MARAPRTSAANVASGINALGRSKTYKRRGLFKVKEKNGGKFPVHAKAAPAAEAKAKAPKFYPAEDAPKPLHKKKTRGGAAGVRASITPGTVLILLVGRFKGKRVVFLKQLPSGLLLVTGPYAVNGVPARRVNAAFVIATSTRVNVDGIATDAFTDAFFAKPAKDRSKSKSAEEFFAAPGAAAKELPAGYLAAQAALDAALKAKLNEETTGYLNNLFTLRAGDKPHHMRF